MTLNPIRDLKGYLSSSAAVTNLVNKNSIMVGSPKIADRFPCIIINQTGGSSFGLLGYGTASAGSKIRKESGNYQLDIYSQISRKEIIDIGDELELVLISGNFRKESDIDWPYDNELKTYRKSQIYSKITFHDD